MAWERIAERKIREAIEEGKFDGLARQAPIDLEDYFKLPPELRLAYSVLKASGSVPEEVELLCTIDRIESALRSASDETTKVALRAELAAIRLRLDLAFERTRANRHS